MYDRFCGTTLILAVLAAGCGSDSPTAPTPAPTTPGTPTAALLSCPASVERPSVDALPVAVTWGLPTVAGIGVDKGACAPVSGTEFPIGESAVTCTADQPALASACSFSVTITPPDLVCPSSVQRQSLDALPVPVTWPLPTVAGVGFDQASCSPVSGSSFPIGLSTVTCTALPAFDRGCSFAISITPPDPSLRFTKFMAFGDSITAGEVGTSGAFGVTARQFRGLLHAAGGRQIPGISRVVLPLSAYPAQLHNLLTPAYRTQVFTVANAGLPGERAAQGVSRLTSALLAGQPEVLMLLQGTVDIDLALLTRPPGNETPINVAPIAADLRSMVLNAQSLGVEVLLATLSPVIDPEDQSDFGVLAAIAALNDEIRSMGPQLGLGIVDLHAALDGVPGVIGADGLHPTIAGYRRMGELFFAEIVSRYDNTPRAPFTAAPNRSMRRRVGR